MDWKGLLKARSVMEWKGCHFENRRLGLCSAVCTSWDFAILWHKFFVIVTVGYNRLSWGIGQAAKTYTLDLCQIPRWAFYHAMPWIRKASSRVLVVLCRVDLGRCSTTTLTQKYSPKNWKKTNPTPKRTNFKIKMPLCLMTCNVMMSVGIPCYQVSLVGSGSSFWFDELGSNPAVTTGGHLRSRLQ